MVCALIKIGNDNTAPAPGHAQLLKDDRTIVLMQSTNGWTNVTLTCAFMKLQLDCPDVPLGKMPDGKARPKVLNFDGHAAHIYNDELKDLLFANDILGLSPPAHTSAPSQYLPGTQQADLSARDGGGIALFKPAFRSRMRKQFRASLQRDKKDSLRGQVKVSQILKMAEDALLESWEPGKSVHLNRTVGYYINSEGYLDYDLLKEYRAANGTCGIAADGNMLKAGPSGRDHREVARDIKRAQADRANTAMVKARDEMEAAGVAVARSKVAPAPDEQPVKRARKDAPNKYGCVVRKSEHVEAGQREEDEAAAAQKKAADKENAFWEQRRAEVKVVEALLAESNGSPGRMVLNDDGKIKKGGVGKLKALIESRSGAPAKSKNNIVAAGAQEGAMLIEARAAIKSNPQTKLPPTPARAATDEADGEVQQGGEAAGWAKAMDNQVVVMCEGCSMAMTAIEVDYHYGEDGMAWCNHCECRVEELEA